MLVKESERLVRASPFVNDVLFYVVGGPKKTDSVDIFIRSLDKWSISGGFSNTETKINPTLDENNFFGLGHELKVDYVWHFDSGQDAYKLNYIVPNIRNTYINTTFRYELDEFSLYAS